MALLRSNVGHIPGIHIHPYGLFDKDKEADFFLHVNNTGENSIKCRSGYFSHSIKVFLRDASSELDRLSIQKIDVLKIDTEGCEVEILQSLSDRLHLVDYIMLEYHTESDRRKIDRLLGCFHLVSLNSNRLGFGVVKYINKRCLDSYRRVNRKPNEGAGH